jgi:hypothetical protein
VPPWTALPGEVKIAGCLESEERKTRWGSMVLVEADRGELLLRLDSRGRGGEAVMGGRLRWRQWAEGCGDGGGGGGESSSNGTTEDAESRNASSIACGCGQWLNEKSESMVQILFVRD